MSARTGLRQLSPLVAARYPSPTTCLRGGRCCRHAGSDSGWMADSILTGGLLLLSCASSALTRATASVPGTALATYKNGGNVAPTPDRHHAGTRAAAFTVFT